MTHIKLTILLAIALGSTDICFFSCTTGRVWTTKLEISDWLQIVAKQPNLPIPEELRTR